MIKYKDIKGTSVEEIICNELHWSHKEPMDNELSKTLLSLLMIEQKMTPEDMKKFDEDLEEQFIFKMIKSRVSCYQFKLSPPVIALLGYLSGTPGKAVLYLTYIQYHVAKKNPGLMNSTITMHDIIMIFPVGFFSEKTLDKAWDAQKIDFREESTRVGSDNLVDHQEAMESIWVR